MKTVSTILTSAVFASMTSVASAQPINAPAPTAGVQAFLDVLNSGKGKPIEQMTPQEARQVLIGAQQGVKLPAAQVSEKTIQVNGQAIKLKIVKPENASGTLPVFMFFHGGGWVLGDFPTHERLIRDLVRASGAAAVYVDYTPSPEARFPVAINQAYEATQWVAEHGQEIGVDGSRLALVGNSVGGNMVASVALQAKQFGGPKIRYNVMLWPVTDANFDNGSYNQYEKGYFLTKNMMKWFWDNYTTRAADRNNILASPLRASTEQLKGFPQTLIQTAELDVLRDEGEAFGRKLDAAGVPVTVTRYNGMIHDYGLLNPLSEEPTVITALEQAGAELQKHLK
ncbi:alpha/beta hydrolase [Pectobacterium brasiliense]|uniref:alpha/beta hydrolase n=1 Tax=Pectobacterium TaxID=122277 RepID=UPI00027E0D8E|nr:MULTISPECIES: alpha/beta hydrolase [Pectobacterium]AFR02272.1 Alpha/beta hydrolase fold-3 domain protein [Pectobacterium carotovorum subsp. carotovorum PCC21]KHS68636.1 alpha/beta hydrolase [Pectobacterium brasiliense]KHS97392.1 alpha/beta hydrolase [Pectobacterium brasiliense]MBN3070076.1 alpha/beta hydrolase [Pectobacterium brasiliense]MBN3246336.1 alpha/beta hydrolase [Pectobacterium brasiliense]